MREPRPFGKHELYVEDDVLFSVPHGDVQGAELKLYTEAAMEIIGQYGYCLILSDNHDLGGITADARRHSAQWTVGKPVLGMGLYNAGLAARTLLTIVLKALSLILRPPIPFAFFATEHEARDWLAGLRRRHRTQYGKIAESHSGDSAELSS